MGLGASEAGAWGSEGPQGGQELKGRGKRTHCLAGRERGWWAGGDLVVGEVEALLYHRALNGRCSHL